MHVRYGELEFEIERVYRWSHRAVYDESGLDFLYNHVVIGVQAVWHARATRSNEVAGGAVIDGAGKPPGVSIRDLRTHMMQPRQLLQVRYGTEIVLESPALIPGRDQVYPCDAKGGPQPINFDVITVYGDGVTMVCVFEVETWLNDYNDPNYTPAILSNRWVMTEEIDELNYVTRHVQGKAIFRKDFLLAHPNYPPAAYPDDFRKRLFFPIPDGYKRDSVRVSPTSDGTAINWSFTDRQQTLNLGLLNPVLKIQGRLRSGYNHTSLMSVATRWYSVSFQVWGRRTSRRQDLINAIARAAAAFGFNDVQRTPTLYYNCSWDIDLVAKFASLTVGLMTSGAFATVFTALFRDHQNLLVNNFPEDIQGVAKLSLDANPRPPYSDGCRADTYVRMVEQALSEPSTVPARPAYPQGGSVSRPLYGAGGY